MEEQATSLEFVPPQGFVPPQTAQEGQPFDIVCTFVPVDGGRLRLTQLGDMPIRGETPESKPDYSAMHQAMMAEMPGEPAEE